MAQALLFGISRTMAQEASLIALAARLEGRLPSSVLLCRKDLLQRYKRTKSTLHRWIAAGRLPAPIRFGAPLWRLSDLEAAELAGQLPPPEEGQAVPIIHRSSHSGKPPPGAAVHNLAALSRPTVRQ